ELLVRRLRGGDDPDAASAVAPREIGEPARHLPEGALPGGPGELGPTPQEGELQPPFSLQVAVAHAARVAHPVLVHVRVLARWEEEGAARAVVDLDVAAVRAGAADRRRPLEVPDAGVEAEVAVRERPNRTDVDHVAGVLVVEHLPRGDVEVDVVAPLVEGEL